jgi:hypothetical protein
VERTQVGDDHPRGAASRNRGAVESPAHANPLDGPEALLDLGRRPAIAERDPPLAKVAKQIQRFGLGIVRAQRLVELRVAISTSEAVRSTSAIQGAIRR